MTTNTTTTSAQPAPARRLKQFVMKPTVYCYHRCPYCDLRQDYYGGMVDARKQGLRLLAAPGERIANLGTCRVTWRCAWSKRRPLQAWRNSNCPAATRCSTRT